MLVGKTPGQTEDQPGDWLRREMLRRGYDPRYGGQSQFARDSDTHVSIINRALKGTPVSLDVLRRMGKAFGRSLGDMLVLSGTATRDELPARPPEELEDAPPPEPDTNPYDDPAERHIWDIPELDDDLKRIMIRFLRTMRASDPAEEQPAAEVRQLRRPS